MKKVLLVLWCFSFIIFTGLTVNYVKNEKMIEHYENDIFSENDISILGFVQPYIYYYNKGNIFYKQGKYELAVESYQKALYSYVPKYKECAIRINMALVMVTPIDMENVTLENKDEIIMILETARDILVEEGCANMEDDHGHSGDAQTLKNEIDAYLDRLNNPEEAEKEQKDEQESDTETSEEQEKNSEEEKNIEKKYEEIEQQGLNERNQNLEDYKNLQNFDFYDGNCW
ncbi:MAG: tetratricopeptide repeat protein [Clostridiales bacterium]|nr:tetratricopeptide repeat protein [Clostridiales bacterium]